MHKRRHLIPTLIEILLMLKIIAFAGVEVRKKSEKEKHISALSYQITRGFFLAFLGFGTPKLLSISMPAFLKVESCSPDTGGLVQPAAKSSHLF